MNSSLRAIPLIALFAALLAVLGLIPKIDLPLGVPITLQTLGVMLAGCMLGAKRGFQALMLFLFAVALGLPLLSGGRGGLGVFFAPSSGYLIGWPLGALATGALMAVLPAQSPRAAATSAFIASALGGLLVVHVIPGSPAQRVGLAAGDHLVGVGGRALAGMNVDEAAQLLQGPEGSVATLAVLRGSGPARAMTVRREHVEVPSVEDVRIIDPVAGVGLVKVTSFQKTTAADLEAHHKKMYA
jgi:biotin transporter BioY